VIIVDTGPLVAIANDRDQHHAVCMALLGEHDGPLLVPAPVVVEVCQLLASRRGTRSEALFLTSLAGGELQLVDLQLADYARAAELVQQYADLPLGAVDAFVIAVAERVGAVEVATLDRRHFSVVRPKHVTALTLMPDRPG
jgi:predicted nucleic acid-binding protein